MIDDGELEIYMEEWRKKINSPEYRENMRKIMNDMMMFNMAVKDENGNHVPLSEFTEPGECEICKAQTPTNK